LFAYSGSPDSGSSTRDFNLDDIAKIDWPAAIDRVREETGRDDVQVIAHCVASMTILMGLLSGEVTGVRSLIASQTTVHPVVNWVNNLKADLGIAPLIRQLNSPSLGIDFREYIDMNSRLDGTKKQHEAALTVDAALWMMPVPDGEECTNPTCHRIFSVFGPAWTHSQLNHETHVALREMTGKISTAPFQQISDITTTGYAITADGKDDYLRHVDRLALPIDFLAGRLNRIFLPETSQRTFDWVKAHNDPSLYTRKVFTDYAHMDIWMGRNAARDIYPYIVSRLDRHQ
jgi:cholesterol oxidase